MKNNLNKFILITPAKNEEKYVTETILSVLKQDVLPIEWIIVDDGSTDDTPKIIKRFCKKYRWIKLLERKNYFKHNFASVVSCYHLALENISKDYYNFIGLLDADIRLPSQYFKKVLHEFYNNSRLGLGGGIVYDIGTKPKIPRNMKDIPGAIQFFRRSCLEDILPFIALPEGGWDMLTCVQARYKGYETSLFTNLWVEHLKPRNISQGSLIKRYFQLGVRDYALAYHPLFETLKCLSRITEYPFLIGSITRLLGYWTCMFIKKKINLPENLIFFIRNEQLERIKITLTS